MIASLSIPWGESKGDEDLGGYHLVWPRDLVHSSTGLLAYGQHVDGLPLADLPGLLPGPARRLLSELLDRRPALLDRRAVGPGVVRHLAGLARAPRWSLGDFDPYPMVLRAAGFLLREGPATDQERWEEKQRLFSLDAGGQYRGARLRGRLPTAGDLAIAQYLHDYADFLESHLEGWTVTTRARWSAASHDTLSASCRSTSTIPSRWKTPIAAC